MKANDTRHEYSQGEKSAHVLVKYREVTTRPEPDVVGVKPMLSSGISSQVTQSQVYLTNRHRGFRDLGVSCPEDTPNN